MWIQPRSLARQLICKSEPTRGYVYWSVPSSSEVVIQWGPLSLKARCETHFGDLFLEAKMVRLTVITHRFSSDWAMNDFGSFSKLKSILKGWRLLISKVNQRSVPGPEATLVAVFPECFYLGSPAVIKVPAPKRTPFKDCGVRWNTWVFWVFRKETRYTTLWSYLICMHLHICISIYH